MNDTRNALTAFTQRYCHSWQQKTGHGPRSSELAGIPSPCIVATRDEQVEWQPQTAGQDITLDAVERALDISLQPGAHAYWCSQFAADMAARFDGRPLTLLQAWSPDDFQRAQENLIGHLVMQRRLKISPTIFLATTADEMEIVALCNLTGEVVLEKLGTSKRITLSSTLPEFLATLNPEID